MYILRLKSDIFFNLRTTYSLKMCVFMVNYMNILVTQFLLFSTRFYYLHYRKLPPGRKPKLHISSNNHLICCTLYSLIYSLIPIFVLSPKSSTPHFTQNILVTTRQHNSSSNRLQNFFFFDYSIHYRGIPLSILCLHFIILIVFPISSHTIFYWS